MSEGGTHLFDLLKSVFLSIPMKVEGQTKARPAESKTGGSTKQEGTISSIAEFQKSDLLFVGVENLR